MSTSMTRSITQVLALLLALACCVLASPSPAWAHDDGAYWHDSGPAGRNPQWMLTINPNKKLTELSLPGTHDTGTFTGIGGDIARTQTMTVREQLDAGIRFFDIRLKYYDRVALRNCNESYSSPNCQLLIFHGGVAQFIEFERDVLKPTIAFLRDNPSEILVMRIAKETGPCDCNPGPALNTLFSQAVVLDGTAIGQKYSDFLLPRSCPDPASLQLGAVRPLNAKVDPKSCDARGKILVMDQYLDSTLADNHFYRHYPNVDFTSLTFQTLRTNFDLHDRLWLPVKAHLASAARDRSSTAFYNVGISGSIGGFPYFFASGHSSPATDAPRLSTGLVDGITADASTYPDFPRTNCLGSLCTISFEGMNTLVADYLMRPEFRQPDSRVGMINIDFPGERVITAVAGVNHGVSFNRPSFSYTLRTPNGRSYEPGSWTNTPVSIFPVCNVICIGDRNQVTEDQPDGFTLTMAGGGRSVSFVTSPVRIDQILPTVSAAATTQPGPQGWYTGNVTVRFSCADAGGSGVAECPPDQVFTQDGVLTSAPAYALDVAGNKSMGSNTVAVKIDKTPPVVSYRGNLGSYSPQQTVDIRCEVVDRDSGVATSSCANIRGLASSFGAGTHRYVASATDVAGNTGSASTVFTVVARPGDVNLDGVVDCQDQAIVKAAFGKRLGAPGFDPRADTNGDGLVDIRDLSFVAQQLPAGSTCR